MSFSFFTLQPSAPDASAPEAGGSAAPQSGSPFGAGSVLLYLIPIVILFFVMRGSTKKQKELEASLKVGDRVFTRGGAVGKITKVGDRIIDLELAPGVNVGFRKEFVEGLDVDPSSTPKDKDKG